MNCSAICIANGHSNSSTSPSQGRQPEVTLEGIFLLFYSPVFSEKIALFLFILSPNMSEKRLKKADNSWTSLKDLN